MIFNKLYFKYEELTLSNYLKKDERNKRKENKKARKEIL